ncbi:CPBP family intramembrane glutamic endopeptidase [Ruminococcus sp.]|uniref:CPBP family intramembrane glutamic endopeptidase n=1 Tax=Ruminococcus sp. TaxID=41978 RepID=UPI0025E717CC|nr:CPBP family intramembrane glutamic endopeptidase [Ruminococcus sp.]MBQ8966167.1 CPBP family intramembrane metalloprotease [Ruminococcus sp.]
MKRSRNTAIAALAIYLLAAPIITGVLNAISPIKLLGDLAGYIFAVVLVVSMTGKNEERTGYGLCRGDHKGLRPLAIILFFMPLINIPYIFVGMDLTARVILQAIYVGFMEEFIFRGAFFKFAKEKWGEHKAIVITSIAFGMIHLLNLGSDKLYFILLQVVYAAGIGFALSVFRAKSGSLLIPVIVHGLVDILGLAARESNYIIDTAGGIVCVAVGVICYVIYRRQLKASPEAQTVPATA